LGIGEDLRMAVAACQAAGIPYRVLNVNAGKELRQADQELSSQVNSSKDQAPYAINIFCLPIFDLVSRIFLAQGPEVFRNYYNIGWSPWELSVWPKAWKGAFDLLDEVWAGSSFSLAMYQKTTLKPCYLMPLAASVERVQTFARKHFKLPIKPFLFLYVFDFNSHLNRKNPSALITAFQKAFPINDRSVGLVLKIMNANPENPVWMAFLNDCKADSRIKIIQQTMDRPEVLGLIKVCDAYVSPHRAEGFGRTLAEAMLFGKPVVATNYSGNASFMDPELTLPVQYDLVSLSQGDYHFIQAEDKAIWAEPSIDHLVERLKEARAFTADFDKVGRLKAFAHERFGVDATAKLMKARMSQIKAQLASQANTSPKKELKSSNS
jgi:glycosyltransferase involved in cell wall biosynthesis